MVFAGRSNHGFSLGDHSIQMGQILLTVVPHK
jgi:hypothetical protein